MGNKANNLLLLQKAGYRVPRLIVCNATITNENELQSIVKKELPGIDIFAVRSSASSEDSASSSMAGYFYSAIGVDQLSLFEEYIKVVDSFNNQVGKVIIQQFIPSTQSGVVFTNRGDGKMLINASLGLCKTVVEGRACDEYVVSATGKVQSQLIAKEKECLFFKNNLLQNEIVRDTASLSSKELKELYKVTKKIEAYFGSPQDIEWCFENGKLYILQSRPITRAIVQTQKQIFYDSANIAESYSGIVLPLTLSFAENIYKIVYQNLLIASGVTRKKIGQNKDIFDNMVGSFYGRLYYNMNNWYHMMAFIPGYNRNKTNLEEMITSNVREDIPLSVLPSVWLKIKYPFIFIFKILTIDISRKYFKNKVKRYLTYFRNAPIHSFDIEQCKDAYQNLSSELLEKWHIPVENDFLVMTYLGLLKKKFSDEQLKELIQFENISSKQVEALQNLAISMLSHQELGVAILNNNIEQFDLSLKNHPLHSAELQKYFDTYGGRFANELKLESSDLSEDTGKLLSLLRLYKDSTVHSKKIYDSKIKLTFFEKYALKKFKKYASQREEMRLLRSNCFGIVRKIFNQWGFQLQKNGLIREAFDIYYLQLNELFQSNYNETDFKQSIKSQKQQYEHFKTIQPKPWFCIEHGNTAPLLENNDTKTHTLQARPCTHGIVKGKAKVFKEFFLPSEIDFDILVTRHTDPGWTPLIGLSKGLVIEHGGILSHAAIVSRELGIPTVIGAENATQLIADNALIQINGTTGLIEIIE